MHCYQNISIRFFYGLWCHFDKTWIKIIWVIIMNTLCGHFVIIKSTRHNFRVTWPSNDRKCDELASHYWKVSIRRLQDMPLRYLFCVALRVGSIPTLHLETFEQLLWATWRKNSRKAQWQAPSRYVCHCAFLVSFRYAGSEKTWPNHFISISLALVTLPTILRR